MRYLAKRSRAEASELIASRDSCEKLFRRCATIDASQLVPSLSKPRTPTSCVCAARSDTVEATDRFGSVLTLRLVRQEPSKLPPGVFVATCSGRLFPRDGESNRRAFVTQRTTLSSSAAKVYGKLMSAPDFSTSDSVTSSDSRGRERRFTNPMSAGPLRHSASSTSQGKDGATVPGGELNPDGPPGLKCLGVVVDEAGIDAVEVCSMCKVPTIIFRECQRKNDWCMMTVSHISLFMHRVLT